MKKRSKKLKTVKKLARPLTIGRTETWDFPDLGLKRVAVKVDTGAFTSSLHCQDIKVVTKGEKYMVHFKLDERQQKLPLMSRKIVKSSFGETEERYTIRTKVLIVGRLLYIEFSLTDRGDMKYPILIGRKFLQKGFIVDVNTRNQIKKQTSKPAKGGSDSGGKLKVKSKVRSKVKAKKKPAKGGSASGGKVKKMKKKTKKRL